MMRKKIGWEGLSIGEALVNDLTEKRLFCLPPVRQAKEQFSPNAC
jgi:hypothetical protein